MTTTYQAFDAAEFFDNGNDVNVWQLNDGADIVGELDLTPGEHSASEVEEAVTALLDGRKATAAVPGRTQRPPSGDPWDLRSSEWDIEA